MYLLPAMPALRVYPPCPRPIMRMPLVCTEKASSTAKRWFYDWCGNLTIESTLRWCILRSPKSVESAVYGASCNAPSTLTVVVQPRNARGKHMQLTSGGRLTTYNGVPVRGVEKEEFLGARSLKIWFRTLRASLNLPSLTVVLQVSTHQGG